MSNAVAAPEASSSLPALAETPASQQMTADDLPIRKVYIGQLMSKAVVNDTVPKGCLYIAAGAEDPDAEVIWTADDKKGVLAYVVGFNKTKTLSVDGGDFEIYDLDDPSAPAAAAITYNYQLVLPEIDDIMPFKVHWTKTQTSAARKINETLMRGANKGPAYKHAFRITTKIVVKEHTWWVPVIEVVTADPKFDDTVEGIYQMIGGDNQPAPSHKARGEQPSI